MYDYCHRAEYVLRYSDFDAFDEIKLPSLLALAQESAGASADELGFGYEALKKKNFGFITANTYCELYAPAKLGDVLTVETWPLPPRHVIFERHYRMTNGEGKIVALLSSLWCLVDLDGFTLLPPEALGEVHARCPYRAERLVPPVVRRIPFEGEGKELYKRRVFSSDCDHYLHANNTRYIDFFLDGFPLSGQPRLSRFRLSYLKQAKEGDELGIFRDDSDALRMEARCGGEVVARFEGERL